MASDYLAQNHHDPDAEPPGDAGRLRFGDCVLDTLRRELRVADQVVPLQPRVYAMLCHLARQPGQVITKQGLLRAVWPTAHVTDAVLPTAMLKLRKAIGDLQRPVPLLATVRGIGYRLDATVELEAADATAPIPDAAAGPLPGLSGRLAMMRFTNASGDASLDWIEFGLPSLLHGKLTRLPQVKLLPLDSSLVWQSRGQRGDLLESACAALGADNALTCTVHSDGQDQMLSARWGASDGTAASWQRRGPQVTLLIEKLATALTSRQPAMADSAAIEATGRRQAEVEASPSFWDGQLARAMDLERRSMAAQALAVLQTCLPHLPATADVTLLHVRLLRQRMALAEAHDVLNRALADGLGLLDGAGKALLHVERALLLQLQRDIPGALQACNAAVAVIAEGLAPIEGLPEVLAAASRIDFDRGQYRQAAHKAQRAMAVAQSLNDKAMVVSSAISHARAAYMDGLVQQAHETLQQAVVLAHDSGLDALEADAYMRLAFQESTRWRHALAADYARRASALASQSGDLATWHRAQMRELTCLIEMGRLDEAEALLERHFQQAAAWDTAVVRNNQRTQRWTLDWRRGRHDSAVDLMQSTLNETPKIAIDRLRRLSYRLMISLLCLDRRAQADQVLAMHRTLGYLTREVHLQAAFAIQQGERARTKHLLRAAWLTNPPQETEAWHVQESLAWLLLEDGESGGLDALMADVAQLPREQPSVPLVLYLHDLRRGTCSFNPGHWAALVGANAGLLNRHAWMLDHAACRAWLRGDGPKLHVLLPDACF